MDWSSYLYSFRDWLFDLPENPPYVLLFAGLFIGLTSGTSFIAVVKQQIKRWQEKQLPTKMTRYQQFGLLIPFLGTFIGLWVFLGAGLQVFGLSAPFAWLIALLLVLLTGAIVWSLLGRSMGRASVRYYLDQTFDPSKST